MLKEKKYIIVVKNGKTFHFKFPTCQSHFYFARDNGFDYFNNVIETGLLIDGKVNILECKNLKHLKKASNKQIDLNKYHDLRLAREAQSRYLYNSKGFIYKLGD